MSSFHFYRWNQFKVIPLDCTIRTKKLPKFSATSDAGCIFVCLSVYLSANISQTTCPLYMSSVTAACCFSDINTISYVLQGFVNDVTFSHNGAKVPKSKTRHMFRLSSPGGDTGATLETEMSTWVHPPVLQVAGRCSVVVVGVVDGMVLVGVVTAAVVDVVEESVVDVQVEVVVVVVVGSVVRGQAVRWHTAWWWGRVSGSHELSSTSTPDDRRQLTARCWTPWPHVVEHWHTPPAATSSVHQSINNLPWRPHPTFRSAWQ